MAQFNPEHKAALDALLLGYPGLRPGKMFGFPAYYAGAKLCITVYEGGVGLKLPAQSAQALLDTDPNVAAFLPMGKARMREWVQITLDRSEDYRQYLPVFEESIQYVLARQGQARA